MSKKLAVSHPIFLLCTCFGFGKMPFAPGTWGSLVAVVFYLALSNYMMPIMLAILPLTIIGIWASDVYLRKNGLTGDPKEIVIDEFVGQIIAIILSIIVADAIFAAPPEVSLAMQDRAAGPSDMLLLEVIVSFCFFRLFDIWKPWPVSYFDNQDGGYGIMMDDVVAGIMGGLASALVFWLV